MSEYLYKAVDQQGKLKSGLIKADDLQSAREQIQKQNLIIKEVKISEETGFSLNSILEIINKFFNRITLQDKVFFTRQLSTILNAGIPLIRALYIQEKQTKKKNFQQVIQTITSDLESGKDFSTSLAKHPSVFDDFYVSLVRAGEVSGSLEESLERLASQLEKTQTLNAKIRSAMIMPAFTLLVMLGVVVLMLVYIIPQLSDLFNEEGVELPITTKILVFASNFIINYWVFIIIILATGIFLLVSYTRTEDGKKVYHNLILKPPIFGPLLQKIYLARFARGLGTMLQDGVPIIQSIQVVAETLTNVHYRKSTLDLIPQIEKGIALGKATTRDSNFPFIMVQMINVGEESGSIAEMLVKIALYYEEEIDNTVKNLTTLIEPFIVIFLAIGVGFVALAILGPIYGLVSVI